MGADHQEAALKVVLDTNTVVSATVFARGRLTWLRHLWQQEQIVPLVATTTAEEIVRVLAYPKFRLEPQEIRTLLEEYLPFTESVILPSRWPRGLAHCSDRHDDVFLHLASHGHAAVLVTGDRSLLGLARSTPFPIENPTSFRARFP